MGRLGDCETCERQDKRFCVGCQPVLRSDGYFSRTLWTPKPELTVTFTTQIDCSRDWPREGISSIG